VQRPVPEARSQASLAHDVDPAAEELFEIGGKSPKAEKTAPWFRLDEKVDIAGLHGLTPRDGSENADRPPAAATSQGFERPTHDDFSLSSIILAILTLE
jgi:hypothetical protein